MGATDYSSAPATGYCATQDMYYFEYKLHAFCGLSGVIHSYDMTPANVYDINYMKDVKFEFYDCSIFGDRTYDWKPTFKPFAKARKRIETNFSQLCDQFMMFRNYAKQTAGLFTRIIGKISAFTVLQYINYINERPISRVKYALS